MVTWYFYEETGFKIVASRLYRVVLVLGLVLTYDRLGHTLFSFSDTPSRLHVPYDPQRVGPGPDKTSSRRKKESDPLRIGKQPVLDLTSRSSSRLVDLLQPVFAGLGSQECSARARLRAPLARPPRYGAAGQSGGLQPLRWCGLPRRARI